jgi:hypothetical protein
VSWPWPCWHGLTLWQRFFGAQRGVWDQTTIFWDQTTILSIDLKSVLRKRKLAQRTSQLVQRPRAELADLTALLGGRLNLLLDTKV